MKKTVNIYELEPGMIVARDVYGSSGQLLIREGVCLTETYIHHFKSKQIKQIEIYESKDADLISPKRFLTDDEQSLIDPRYLSSFIKELELDIGNYCRKMLTPPTYEQDFVNDIEAYLKKIIQKPIVLNCLLKVKLTDNGFLAKALQVAILSTVMGRKMVLSLKQLQNLTIAALLYDIGNFWINRSILSKPTSLTEWEKRSVEEHTIIGYSVLKDFFDEEIARAAYQHHERYDGSGYPNKAKREEIDLLPKVISICDVYISLINSRPFRQRYEPPEALEYILGAGGTLFDPEHVSLFLEIIPLYSVGSMVELSNGCIGMIVKTTDNPIGRPVVEVLFDKDGQRLKNHELDLKEHLTISVKKVLQ